ncbi:MAG: formate dehydrogenase accessory sulfurtransferase FdhD [Firmicutes bacterium]|nr:formate dehydrogenase accessory sulfurtransferase FdhD [Bacillota bacterium]
MLEKVVIHKLYYDTLKKQEDLVIKEFKANLYVNGSHYISLMCLPQHLEELAVGFLFAEGVIGAYQDVQGIELLYAGDINISLRNGKELSPASNRTLVSGFGQGSVNDDFFKYENLPKVLSKITTSPNEVVKMTTLFNKRSELFRQTGAVHSASLILSNGKNLFYEDIGRHNALDKIIGKALITGLSLEESVLITSGRISSEMLLKTARAGIPILISVSAPTDLAIDLAKKINLTLIGFSRDGGFNVYAGEGRVALL